MIPFVCDNNQINNNNLVIDAEESTLSPHDLPHTIKYGLFICLQ